MGKFLGIVILIVAVVGLIAFGTYNGLVAKDEAVASAWAQVETVLQRRYDLIPNLVSTVKGYAKHESAIFDEVARLRSQWADAKGPEARVQAAGQLETGLGRLIAVAENYPQLKADANFRSLQDELAGTENRVSVERQRYNSAIQTYNTAVRKFPGNVLAGMFGLNIRTGYFKADEGAAKAPTVQF